MATALFYGFDETTTVNLGHKITLYSQPKKIFVEEMGCSFFKEHRRHRQICLFDCFNERKMSVFVRETTLSYGFDETTTVNLGHKITLYSQPKKILIEEVVMKKLMFVHLFVILDKPTSKFGMSVLFVFVQSALFYGFDKTTMVNLGHKITLYSQPKKIIVEEKGCSFFKEYWR